MPRAVETEVDSRLKSFVESPPMRSGGNSNRAWDSQAILQSTYHNVHYLHLKLPRFFASNEHMPSTLPQGRFRTARRIASTRAANSPGRIIGMPLQGDISTRSISLETMRTAPLANASSKMRLSS